MPTFVPQKSPVPDLTLMAERFRQLGQALNDQFTAAAERIALAKSGFGRALGVRELSRPVALQPRSPKALPIYRSRNRPIAPGRANRTRAQASTKCAASSSQAPEADWPALEGTVQQLDKQNGRWQKQFGRGLDKIGASIFKRDSFTKLDIAEKYRTPPC